MKRRRSRRSSQATGLVTLSVESYNVQWTSIVYSAVCITFTPMTCDCSHCKHGKNTSLQLLLWLQARSRAGYPSNKFTVTSTMTAWQRTGQTKQALAMFQQAVSEGVADVDVYNAAMAVCMNSKQAKVSACKPASDGGRLDRRTDEAMCCLAT